MIERLGPLKMDEVQWRRLELPNGDLILRRCWARSRDHLQLEYVDAAGAPVAGQWLRDADSIERVRRETMERSPAAPCALIECGGTRVLLQPHGADRRLDGLAALCREAGTTLLTHRPERRAVVRDERSTDTRYVKIVRAQRVHRLLEATTRFAADGEPAFALARPLQVDEGRGWLVRAALPGRSLFDLLGDDAGFDRDLAHAVGGAVAWLHQQDATGLARHGSADESRLLRELCERVAAFAPGLPLDAPLRRVLLSLCGAAAESTSLHRDLHDKQILVDERGRIGLLDFDTMAAGEAALDVANLLAHLELRQLQGRCTRAVAAAAADGFLDGYRPTSAVSRRLPAYLDAARLRLACVYALRPRWSALAPELLQRIGAAAPDEAGGRAGRCGQGAGPISKHSPTETLR